MVRLNLMITAYISYTYTKNHNSHLQEDFIVIINFMITISFIGNVVLEFLQFLQFLNLENSNLMIVITSTKTKFVIHFSYLWNGALINGNIPKKF